MKEMQIEATVDNLHEALAFVSSELGPSISNKSHLQVEIAAEEIFINIATHAYSPETGSLTIRVSMGDRVIIEFEDTGKSYNPLDKPDPDIFKTVDELDSGGLGVFMVKQIMDSVEYKREDGKNILTITKALSATTKASKI